MPLVEAGRHRLRQSATVAAGILPVAAAASATGIISARRIPWRFNTDRGRSGERRMRIERRYRSSTLSQLAFWGFPRRIFSCTFLCHSPSPPLVRLSTMPHLQQRWAVRGPAQARPRRSATYVLPGPGTWKPEILYSIRICSPGAKRFACRLWGHRFTPVLRHTSTLLLTREKGGRTLLTIKLRASTAEGRRGEKEM